MKRISIVLIIIILFNFIFCNYISYADDEEDDDETITYSKEAYDKLTEEGTVELNEEETDVSTSTSAIGSASGTVASLFTPPFMVISLLLSNVASLGGITGGDGYTDLPSSAYNTGMFTICSLVFGEYLLFNANVYQTNADLNPDIESNTVSNIIDEIKELIVGWFYVFKLVAIAIMLVLIIFTGIKLATSQLSDKKARYKEVIKAWVEGLIFVLLLEYIVVILNVIIDGFLDILWTIRYSLENNGYSSFEYELLNICMTGIAQYGGMKALAYAIEYIAFVGIQIAFFIKYFWRLVKIFIMILFAPIIGVMHVFSKLRGGPGLIGNWILQYTMCLSMQPMHALIYIIFTFTASQIAINAPLLGIVFLWVMLRAEKIMRIILNVDYGKIVSLFKKKK